MFVLHAFLFLFLIIKLEKTRPKRESRALIQTVQEFIFGAKDSPFCWQQNDHFLF
jgi:hypothetical protein